MNQPKTWNSPRNSPIKSSLRLSSRFSQLADGAQPHTVEEDSPSTQQSVLNWKVPARKGKLLKGDGDRSVDEGPSVDEFYFSTEAMPVTPKPTTRPRKAAEIDFTPDWDNVSDKTSNKASVSSTVALSSQSHQASLDTTKPRRRRSSFTERELHPKQTATDGWAAFDADADSTKAVSPPTSPPKMWSATISGESSPKHWKNKVSPQGRATIRLSPSSKQSMPDNLAPSALPRRQSATRIAMSLSLFDHGEGDKPFNESPASPIKPLSPPKSFTAQRQTPQRRVVKISASDLGLSSREALDPDIVRSALRRLKSDSGESLLGSNKLDPSTPTRSPRRRMPRAQNVTSMVNRIQFSALNQDDAEEKHSPTHTPLAARHGLRQKGMRRSESLTELAMKYPVQPESNSPPTPVTSQSARASRTVLLRSPETAPLRPRSLSRGADGRRASVKSSGPLLSRRQSRVSPAETKSLDNARHSLQMLATMDASNSERTGLGRSCSDSIASFGDDDRPAQKSLRRSRSDSYTKKTRAPTEEKSERLRSRRSTLSRSASGREDGGGVSIDQVFASAIESPPPSRVVKRSDSGLTFQLIDQVGLSTQQLKGLRELGLTIKKV